jgi:cell division septation protein DedD/nucleoid DNA-binding protein
MRFPEKEAVSVFLTYILGGGFVYFWSMNSVESYIKALLREQDCVVLPDFGGFVAHPEPAQFDALRNKVSPPGRKLSFNSRLTKNDGSLIYAVSIGDRIQYDEAAVRVEQFVNNIRKELQDKGNVVISGIGAFRGTTDRMEFFPQESSDFDNDSFGLMPVYAKPIRDNATVNLKRPEAREMAKATPAVEKEAPLKESSDRSSRKWVYAAAMIPLALYLVWIPTKSDLLPPGNRFEASDLNPFAKSESVYSERSITEAPVVDESENSNSAIRETEGNTVIHLSESGREIAVYKASPATSSESETTVNEVPEEIEAKSVLPYHIIVGCFSSEYNANRLVTNLKQQGFDALVVDMNKGLYRVSAGGYKTQTQANGMLPRVRQGVNASAWITKKD